VLLAWDVLMVLLEAAAPWELAEPVIQLVRRQHTA
jgi:hypothetical protein